MGRLLFAMVLCAGCATDPSDQGAADMTKPASIPDVHRVTAEACPADRPPFNCSFSDVAPTGCDLDTTCTFGRNGRCVGNYHDGCHCSYDSCDSDANCPSGRLCSCRTLWHYGSTTGPNECLPANCRIDADCGVAGYCSPTLDPMCGAFTGVTGWFCHTADDTCVNDSDCAGIDGGSVKPFCGYRPEVGHWACSDSGCLG